MISEIGQARALEGDLMDANVITLISGVYEGRERLGFAWGYGHRVNLVHLIIDNIYLGLVRIRLICLLLSLLPEDNC